MKRSVLFASMAIASGLTLTNIYTSIVDVPAWSHNVPTSIDVARQYFSVSNPGHFFRIFSPINQVLGLLSLFLFWKRSREIRFLLLGAFACYFIAEGLTFQYFYPRNAILFGAQPADPATLKSVLTDWSSMNWLRTAIVAAGVICSALALNKTYLAPALRKQASKVPEQAGLAMA
jgi:hypothetical protein